jgi:kynureninase
VSTDRASAAALDGASPLSGRRELFDIPDGLVYLCGNSLGALPRSVPERVDRMLRDEWGAHLVSGWNVDAWTELSKECARAVAPLVGVSPRDLQLGDSTTVTLFKLMVAAARLRADRTVLVVEPTTFPTDAYVAAGVARTLGLELRWCDPADPAASLDADVALLCLSHVDFRTGAMYDLTGLTAAAHDVDALVLWDLCHTAGAIPVDLTHAGADMAVGCTYKYLNGGPGAPAYAWVRPELQTTLEQPITGWWGHAEPFAMRLDHEPADGIRRLASGTPPVLGLTALGAALQAFDGVEVDDLRTVSLSLTDLFVDLLDQRLGDRVEVITPREHDRRGSQVSLRHRDAYGIVQALIARGVVGDFRDPDIARFGVAPLYVRHVDVHDAVDHLVAVLDAEEHLDPRYRSRLAVT